MLERHYVMEIGPQRTLIRDLARRPLLSSGDAGSVSAFR